MYLHICNAPTELYHTLSKRSGNFKNERESNVVQAFTATIYE